MKKILTFTIKRLLPVLVFLTAQVKTWAVDTTTATTVDKGPTIFSQPWIWIGVVTVLAIKLMGPFTNTTKDFVVIRKKQIKSSTQQ